VFQAFADRGCLLLSLGKQAVDGVGRIRLSIGRRMRLLRTGKVAQCCFLRRLDQNLLGGFARLGLYLIFVTCTTS